MLDTWKDEGATDAGQHLLLCGPCNGQPGRCTRRIAGECSVCGGHAAKGRYECRSCALERWRGSR